jgi:hypothetical protein
MARHFSVLKISVDFFRDMNIQKSIDTVQCKDAESIKPQKGKKFIGFWISSYWKRTVENSMKKSVDPQSRQD